MVHGLLVYSVGIVAAMTFPAAQHVFPMRLALENIILSRAGIRCFQNRKLKLCAVIRPSFCGRPFRFFLFPCPFSELSGGARSMASQNVWRGWVSDGSAMAGK